VAALADAIEAHRARAREPLAARDRAANQVRRALAALAARRAAEDSDWDSLVGSVADRSIDPLTAAEILLGHAGAGLNAATIALRSGSKGAIVIGILQEAGVADRDDRDVMVGLAALHDAATRVGLDPAVEFARAADGLPGERGDLVRAFGKRSDVTLERFGWRLVDLPDGPAYRLTL
jgi:hypothetical protein